jgi:hypothetical protein
VILPFGDAHARAYQEKIDFSYLIFAAEIKINIKNATAFLNAMQCKPVV